MFMPLVETAIAFTVVILAASLFVSAIVHLIQSVLKWRGHTVKQMLTQLMHGFQDANDDADLKDPNKRASAHARARQFASDVLSDPSLHSREKSLEWQDDPDKLAET